MANGIELLVPYFSRRRSVRRRSSPRKSRVLELFRVSRHAVKENQAISDSKVLDLGGGGGEADSAGHDFAIVDIELRACSLRAVEAPRGRLGHRNPHGNTRKV